MKIVGFAQLRNELENGNLKNWFKTMEFCDSIYIYDQDSTDGSKEYYKKFKNTVVIESPINDFTNEMKCKGVLLTKLLEEQPDTDWIVWLDGDTIIDARLTNQNAFILKMILESHLDKEDVDSIVLGHYNLWRSDIHYRIDSLFNWLHDEGVCAIWRNNGKLKFDPVGGLHREQYPEGVDRGVRFKYSLIHRGFATDDQIIRRINHYKTIPDTSWDKTDAKDYKKGSELKAETIERFLNEDNLQVEQLTSEMIPAWFVINDVVNPKDKKRIREIYEERN